MFKIDYIIPEETITLENSRELEAMSLDDVIYWCFLAQVRFSIHSQSLLLLSEVCLFQIVDGFSRSTKEVLTKDKSQIVVMSRYSNFTLYIESFGGEVCIREQFEKTRLQLSISEYVKGTKNFVESVIAQSKSIFPNLNLNPNYVNAVKSWQADILT